MSNNEELLEAIKDYLAMKDEEVLAANNRVLKLVKNNEPTEKVTMEPKAMDEIDILFVDVKEFKKITGLSEYYVRRMLKIKDFPKLRCGRKSRFLSVPTRSGCWNAVGIWMLNILHSMADYGWKGR